MLFNLPNRMACGVEIVKNRIRQQYPVVYETGKTMLIGYARVSKSDGTQVIDPQISRFYAGPG